MNCKNNINRNIKNFALLFAIIILHSCNCEDTYCYLPEDKKLACNLNDTLIYTSNNNQQDTLFISDIKQCFLEERNEDLCETMTYTETIRVTLTHINNTKNEYINQYGNSSGITWDGHSFFFLYTQHSPVDSLIINNYKYIYIVNEYQKNDSLPLLFFSIKYGVIQYITSDSTIWKLQ